MVLHGGGHESQFGGYFERRRHGPGVRAVLHRHHRLGRPRANRLRGDRRPFQCADWHSFIDLYGPGDRAVGVEPPQSLFELGRQ